VLALVPMWIATARNSRASYDSAVRLTPIDRERTYLANVLSNREMAKEVRSFALNGFLRTRYDRLYAHRILEVWRLVRRRIVRAAFASIVGSVSLAGSVAVLVWLLLDHRMTLAAAGTAVTAIMFLGQRLRLMISSAGSLYESSLFIEDVNLFLALRPPDRAGDLDPPSRDFTRIDMDAVSFWYPGSTHPAVNGVSLHIEQGEVVALVGDNGSGKTTVAKLLALLHQPTVGRITWDGVDCEMLDAEHVRRSIAVIFQDFGHYWLSARDNIALGDTRRADELDRIQAAAAAAGADEFLSRLPRKYETVLSRLFEGGRELSVGQWQRIALARALFREAPLVIMDEPTAALDPIAEHDLFSHIRELARGRSVLLISHRFSSVRSADRIYVLSQGEVVEEGTHDELMAEEGRYARMFSLQASAYLDEARRVDPA
jgi:ATP-binding cassette subfamily B protein